MLHSKLHRYSSVAGAKKQKGDHHLAKYEELSDDFSMLGEDADEEEVHDFIEMLDEQEQQKKTIPNSSSKELGKELKKNLRKINHRK